MEYGVLLTQRAVKNLKKLPEPTSERIKAKIKTLAGQPKRRGQQIKPSKYFKTRLGDYRIIYRIKKETKKVVVLFIGHRSKVYDNFTKLV